MSVNRLRSWIGSLPGRAMQLKRAMPLLRRNDRGLALIEFAYVAPILLTLGLGGAELTNFALAQMRVSQLALSMADNASRAKQFVVGAAPRFREFDVKEVFQAAQLQSGDLDMRTNGRIVVSSLERNAQGGQWIHWQRCYGNKSAYRSAYGPQGTGATGTGFQGMGPTGSRVAAEQNFAIMYVEVFFEYKPLVLGSIVPAQTISKSAAMYVRDSRDLTGDTSLPAKYGNVFNPVPSIPDAQIGFCN